MGTCGTKLTKEEKNELMISKQIDKKATNDFKTVDEAIKVLLLGPGESGKSTLLKQMHALYSRGYDEEEMRSYIHIIRDNLLSSFQILLEMSDTLEQKGIENTKISEANQPLKQEILETNDLTENSPAWKEVCEKISKLWQEEPGLKVVYENRAMFQMPGSGDYFIEQAKDIGQPGFFPTQDDILRARVRTTGIVEKEFAIGKTKFRVFDVGGQRNERKKWIHCFEDVTCVIFLVALSAYDEFLYEDETVPRMKEAMDLFEEISNSRYFKNTSMVLFLNKSDLFREKIKKIPLKVMFDDYEGLQQFEEAVEFVKTKFLELNNSKGKEIYTHITCATDNDNIKHVMAAVTDVFIKQKLAKGGLLY